MFAFARVHMRPITPIRHDRTGPKRRGERRKRAGDDAYIYPRGCENASLIKSILGNRRCMNDGARARKGDASGLASEKIRAYRGITARNFLSISRRRSLLARERVEFAYGANRSGHLPRN